MLEKEVEGYLVRQVVKLGGKAYKFSSPSNRSIPDRLCCLPQGLTKYVECKALGKRPTPLQWKVIEYLRSLGHEVLIVDSKEMVDILINMWKEELECL